MKACKATCMKSEQSRMRESVQGRVQENERKHHRHKSETVVRVDSVK